AASGAWSYTPNANFNGTDSFSVTITDDLDGSTLQVVSITINAVAAPPGPTTASNASNTELATNNASSEDLSEPLTASDGSMVDGNRDGLPDAMQASVTAVSLINNGAAGTDYGAVEASEGEQLASVTVITPDPETGNLEVTARDGSTVVTNLPSGITNAFDGAVAFDITGVEAGGSTLTTITLPRSLGTINTEESAYLRFNYLSNRFEEYVDGNGKPLYSLQDTDGDGTPDTVILSLTDGDRQWDGDGIANGTIVDPGFLASGARKLTGTKHRDTLTGNVLSNSISGHRGNDRIFGDLGADHLTGGKGKDRFIYLSTDESTAMQQDTVSFGKKDRFDFRSLDGNSAIAGQQALDYIGRKTFTGSAGELRYTGSGLQADTTGDGIADFAVSFAKTTPWFSETNILL
nr:cadherin-like domain-containing protein [Cyanobacteriota bacterium]